MFFYIRDAQGNVMAVYKLNIDPQTQTTIWTVVERNIYGSDRLGVYAYPDTVYPAQGAPTADYTSVWRGYRKYELKNHLGNVVTVVSGHKIPVQDGSSIGHFTAQIEAAYDYSPFGVTRMEFGGYRWGFQGQERDDEIFKGGSLNYKYRMHRPDLGRFFAVDPLYKEYPWNSTYAFSENRVVDGVDLEGLEYLSDKEAMVEIIAGGVFLKVENFSTLSQKNMMKDPSYGQIQLNNGRAVGGFGFGGEFLVEAPTRQNNQIARISTPRFGPEPSYVPSLKSGGAARAMGVGVFVINAINFSFQTYAAFTIDNDRRQLMNQTMDRTVLNGLWPAFGNKRWNEEISTLSLVREDIMSAIELGIITSKIQQNVEQMSQISNRVLFGADIQNDEIRNVADRIINEISTPRYNEVNDNNRIIINKDDK